MSLVSNKYFCKLRNCQGKFKDETDTCSFGEDMTRRTMATCSTATCSCNREVPVIALKQLLLKQRCCVCVCVLPISKIPLLVQSTWHTQMMVLYHLDGSTKV